MWSEINTIVWSHTIALYWKPCKGNLLYTLGFQESKFKDNFQLLYFQNITDIELE